MDANPYESPSPEGPSVSVDAQPDDGNGPSANLFRVVAAGGLGCWILVVFVDVFGVDLGFTEEVKDLRNWNYYGALATWRVVQAWWVASLLLDILATITLICFWRIGRSLSAVLLIANVIARPFLGLVVLTPFEATLAAVSVIAQVWTVTVSYWSPLTHRFP
jgi:hypothetical protein